MASPCKRPPPFLAREFQASVDAYSRPYGEALIHIIITAHIYLVLFPVPSGFPQNLVGSFVNSTALNFSWNEPLLSQQNGDIVGYRYTYYITSSLVEVDASEQTNTTVDTAIILAGLEKFTVYNFTVRAFTVNGTGPGISDAVRTDSDSKQNFHCCWILLLQP